MKTLLIAAIALLGITASAATLTITIEVKNDAQDTVLQTRTINIADPAVAARINAAFGGDVDAVKAQIVQHLKETVVRSEQAAVRDQKFEEMVAAEQAVTEPTVE